jgi:hypothetical protein
MLSANNKMLSDNLLSADNMVLSETMLSENTMLSDNMLKYYYFLKISHTLGVCQHCRRFWRQVAFSLPNKPRDLRSVPEVGLLNITTHCRFFANPRIDIVD